MSTLLRLGGLGRTPTRPFESAAKGDRRSTKTILLAESNACDARLFLLAIEADAADCHVVWLRDGQEVVDFITSAWQRTNGTPAPLADLLVLNVELPQVDGLKVLRWLRTLYRSDMAAMPPAVVFSTQDDLAQISDAYRAGAASVVQKPETVKEFVATVHKITNYWLHVSIGSPHSVAITPAVCP